MWKAFSGRSESGSTTSGLRRKKSSSGRPSSDAGALSSSKRSEHGSRKHRSSRSAYGDEDEGSSVYATAPSSRTNTNGPSGLTESAVRALGDRDDDWEDENTKDARSEKRSRNGGESERRLKSSRSEKERSRSGSRERKERRRQSASEKTSSKGERSRGKSRASDIVEGPGNERGIPAMGSFDQFPGQYDSGMVGPSPQRNTRPVMSGALPTSDPAHQFPQQIPAKFDRPQFGPTRADSFGAAADYYLDEGESVQHQPGIRSGSPNMLVNPDLHLHAASAEAKVTPDTGHGSAADYYGGAGNVANTSPARPNISDKTTSKSSSKTSTLGRIASTTAAAAATGGVLAAAGRRSDSSKQSTPVKPPRPEVSSAAKGAASYSQGSATYSSPTSAAYRQTSGKSSSNITANVPGYAETTASRAPPPYDTSQSYSQQQTSYTDTTFEAAASRSQFGSTENVYNNGGGTSRGYRYHEHRGPMTRLKDGFFNLISDPDDVRRMEEYTEYIGVCKHCFDPRSTPLDGPRRHHYHRRPSEDSFEELRRRKSYERLQRKHSNEMIRKRVDKDSRYHGDRREQSSKSNVLGAGLAAAGVAAGANALFNDRRNFDDTYSVKSGHRASSAVRRRSRSSSRERRRRTEHGVVRRDSSTDYVSVRTKDGKIERRRVSRERKSGFMGAAAGAALGATAVSMMDSGSRDSLQNANGAFVRRRSGSRSWRQSPTPRPPYGYEVRSSNGNGRQSSNGQYYDASDRRQGQEATGIFGTFFSPSQNERKYQRQGRERSANSKGFFGFGEGSSSSDEDFAFGDGYNSKMNLPLRRKQSSRSSRRRSSENIAATVAGIGATAAALAAVQKGQRLNKQGSRPELGAKRDVKVYHDGKSYHPADEEEWEDELPSDVDDASSVHSGLAFGTESRLSHRQSMESVSSGDGLSAWGWRWGGKDRKQKRRPSSPDDVYRPYPHSSVQNTVMAGSVPADRSYTPPSHVAQQPLQYVDPRPVSDVNTPMPGSWDVPNGRPGLAPLQQPQPIVPISPATVENAVLQNERPMPKRTASSPTRGNFGIADAALIGAGALAAGSIIASQGRARKDSNVRFGLTDEQQQREDRQRRRERDEAEEERRRNDRTRALKDEADRHAKEQDARRRDEDSRRRQEEEIRMAAEAVLQRERTMKQETDRQAELARQRSREAQQAEQHRLQDEVATQEQSRKQREIAAAAVTAAAVTAAEVAAREKKTRDAREAQIEAQIEARQRELEVQAQEHRRSVEEREGGEQEEDERRRDQEAKRLRDEERSRAQDYPRESSNETPRKKSSSSWGNVAMDAAAAATVGAVLAGAEHGRSRERDEDRVREHDRHPESQALYHPVADSKPTSYAAKQILPDQETSGAPIMDDDLFNKDFFNKKRNDTEPVRNAGTAREYDNMVSGMQDYYSQAAPSQAEFFAPKEILSQETAGKTAVASPNADNGALVYYNADDELRSRFGDGYGRGKHAPYGVPALNVISPTPPPSSPSNAAAKGRFSRPPSALANFDIPVEPRTDAGAGAHAYASAPLVASGKRDRSRSISWGEDKTHHYDPPTPESFQERGSYMEAKDSDADAGSAGVGREEETPRRQEEGRNEGTAGGFARAFAAAGSTFALGGFGKDSPGTEGAPAVRGWVEGETDEPTPVKERVPHIPGGFDDDDSQDVTPVGEVISPPARETSLPEWEPPLTKKEQKKREKAAKLAAAFENEPSGTTTPIVQTVDTMDEEPADYFATKTSKKDKKKGKKGAKLIDTFDNEPSEASTPVVSDMERSMTMPEEEPLAEFSSTKKDKKKGKKAARFADAIESETSAPSTPFVEAMPVVEAPADDDGEDFFMSKKDKKKRDKARHARGLDGESVGSFMPILDVPEAPLAMPTEIVEDEAADSFTSKKDKKKRDKALQRGMSDLESSPIAETSWGEYGEQSQSTKETASEADGMPKLSKKEQKKRDKEAQKSGLGNIAAAAVATAGIATLANSAATPEPEDEWSASSSDKAAKKGKKSREPERDIRDIEPRNLPREESPSAEKRPHMPGDWQSDTVERAQEAPAEAYDPFQYQVKDEQTSEPTPTQDNEASFDDFATSASKKSKKKKKRDSGRFNEPAAASPLRSEWNYDDYMGEQVEHEKGNAETTVSAEPESYTNGGAKDESQSNRTEHQGFTTGDRFASEPSQIPYGTEPEQRRKAQSEVRGAYADDPDYYDDRSVAASEPVGYHDAPFRSKRRSRREDDDDAASTVSSRSRKDKDKEEPSSAKKDKKGGLFGLFSRKSADAVPQSKPSDEPSLSRTSTRDGDEDDGERKHRHKKHRDSSSVLDDDDTRSVVSEGRRKHRHRDSSSTRDDDDTRSVTSESRRKHRHRDDEGLDSSERTRSSRHGSDELETRSEAGHKHRRHRHDDEEADNDDTASRADTEGGYRHHRRKRTGESDSKDQSFLGDRVEILPPLPSSIIEDSSNAANSIDERGYGSPVFAVSEDQKKLSEREEERSRRDGDGDGEYPFTVLGTQMEDVEVLPALPASRPESPSEDLPALSISRPESGEHVDRSLESMREVPALPASRPASRSSVHDSDSRSGSPFPHTPQFEDVERLPALPMSRPESPENPGYDREVPQGSSPSFAPESPGPSAFLYHDPAQMTALPMSRTQSLMSLRDEIESAKHLPLPKSRPQSPVISPATSPARARGHKPTLSWAYDLRNLSGTTSSYDTPDRPALAGRFASTTAIPVRFPFGHPPAQPHKERSLSFSFPAQQATPTSPTTPGRKSRPTSTEIRPLYLVERNRKTPEVEEMLPSLPSSKPSSRASSIQGSEDWHSAVEDPSSPSRERALRIDTSRAGSWNDEDDYLGSEQNTPRASDFPHTEYERHVRQEPQFYTWEDFEQDERLHDHEHNKYKAASGSRTRSISSHPSNDPRDEDSVSQPLPNSRPMSPEDLEQRPVLEVGQSANVLAAAAMLGGAALLESEARNVDDGKVDESNEGQDRGFDVQSHHRAGDLGPKDNASSEWPVRKSSKKKGKGKSKKGSKQSQDSEPGNPLVVEEIGRSASPVPAHANDYQLETPTRSDDVIEHEVSDEPEDSSGQQQTFTGVGQPQPDFLRNEAADAPTTAQWVPEAADNTSAEALDHEARSGSTAPQDVEAERNIESSFSFTRKPSKKSKKKQKASAPAWETAEENDDEDRRTAPPSQSENTIAQSGDRSPSYDNTGEFTNVQPTSHAMNTPEGHLTEVEEPDPATTLLPKEAQVDSPLPDLEAVPILSRKQSKKDKKKQQVWSLGIPQEESANDSIPTPVPEPEEVGPHRDVSETPHDGAQDPTSQDIASVTTLNIPLQDFEETPVLARKQSKKSKEKQQASSWDLSQQESADDLTATTVPRVEAIASHRDIPDTPHDTTQESTSRDIASATTVNESLQESETLPVLIRKHGKRSKKKQNSLAWDLPREESGDDRVSTQSAPGPETIASRGKGSDPAAQDFRTQDIVVASDQVPTSRETPSETPSVFGLYDEPEADENTGFDAPLSAAARKKAKRDKKKRVLQQDEGDSVPDQVSARETLGSANAEGQAQSIASAYPSSFASRDHDEYAATSDLLPMTEPRKVPLPDGEDEEPIVQGDDTTHTLEPITLHRDILEQTGEQSTPLSPSVQPQHIPLPVDDPGWCEPQQNLDARNVEGSRLNSSLTSKELAHSAPQSLILLPHDVPLPETVDDDLYDEPQPGTASESREDGTVDTGEERHYFPQQPIRILPHAVPLPESTANEVADLQGSLTEQDNRTNPLHDSALGSEDILDVSTVVQHEIRPQDIPLPSDEDELADARQDGTREAASSGSFHDDRRIHDVRGDAVPSSELMDHDVQLDRGIVAESLRPLSSSALLEPTESSRDYAQVPALDSHGAPVESTDDLDWQPSSTRLMKGKKGGKSKANMASAHSDSDQTVPSFVETNDTMQTEQHSDQQISEQPQDERDTMNYPLGGDQDLTTSRSPIEPDMDEPETFWTPPTTKKKGKKGSKKQIFDVDSTPGTSTTTDPSIGIAAELATMVTTSRDSPDQLDGARGTSIDQTTDADNFWAPTSKRKGKKGKGKGQTTVDNDPIDRDSRVEGLKIAASTPFVFDAVAEQESGSAIDTTLDESEAAMDPSTERTVKTADFWTAPPKKSKKGKGKTAKILVQDDNNNSASRDVDRNEYSGNTLDLQEKQDEPAMESTPESNVDQQLVPPEAKSEASAPPLEQDEAALSVNKESIVDSKEFWTPPPKKGNKKSKTKASRLVQQDPYSSGSQGPSNEFTATSRPSDFHEPTSDFPATIFSATDEQNSAGGEIGTGSNVDTEDFWTPPVKKNGKKGKGQSSNNLQIPAPPVSLALEAEAKPVAAGLSIAEDGLGRSVEPSSLEEPTSVQNQAIIDMWEPPQRGKKGKKGGKDRRNTLAEPEPQSSRDQDSMPGNADDGDFTQQGPKKGMLLDDVYQPTVRGNDDIVPDDIAESTRPASEEHAQYATPDSADAGVTDIAGSTEHGAPGLVAAPPTAADEASESTAEPDSTPPRVEPEPSTDLEQTRNIETTGTSDADEEWSSPFVFKKVKKGKKGKSKSTPSEELGVPSVPSQTPDDASRSEPAAVSVNQDDEASWRGFTSSKKKSKGKKTRQIPEAVGGHEPVPEQTSQATPFSDANKDNTGRALDTALSLPEQPYPTSEPEYREPHRELQPLPAASTMTNMQHLNSDLPPRPEPQYMARDTLPALPESPVLDSLSNNSLDRQVNLESTASLGADSNQEAAQEPLPPLPESPIEELASPAMHFVGDERHTVSRIDNDQQMPGKSSIKELSANAVDAQYATPGTAKDSSSSALISTNADEALPALEEQPQTEARPRVVSGPHEYATRNSNGMGATLGAITGTIATALLPQSLHNDEEESSSSPVRASKKDRKKAKERGISTPATEDEPEAIEGSSKTILPDFEHQRRAAIDQDAAFTDPVETAADLPDVFITVPKKSKKDKRKAKNRGFEYEAEPSQENFSPGEVTVLPEDSAVVEMTEYDNLGSSRADSDPREVQPPMPHDGGLSLSDTVALDGQPASLDSEWPTFNTKRPKKDNKKNKIQPAYAPTEDSNPIISAFYHEGDSSTPAGTLISNVNPSLLPAAETPMAQSTKDQISMISPNNPANDSGSGLHSHMAQLDDMGPSDSGDWPTVAPKKSKKAKRQAKNADFETESSADIFVNATTEQETSGSFGRAREVTNLYSTDATKEDVEASDRLKSDISEAAYEERLDTSAARVDEPEQTTATGPYESPDFSTKRTKKDRRKVKKSGTSLPNDAATDADVSVEPRGDSDDKVTSIDGIATRVPLPYTSDDHDLEEARSHTPKHDQMYEPILREQDTKSEEFSSTAPFNKRDIVQTDSDGDRTGHGAREDTSHRRVVEHDMPHPVTIDRDIDFAATLAAGLADTGFNPDLVVSDPIYQRRASPPGAIAEADPEEAFTMTTKRKKKSKKSRVSETTETSPQSVPQDLNKDGNAESVESTKASHGPAAMDHDMLQALQQSGFDAATIEQAINARSNDPSSPVVDDDAPDVSFAVSKRKKKGKNNAALFELPQESTLQGYDIDGTTQSEEVASDKAPRDSKYEGQDMYQRDEQTRETQKDVEDAAMPDYSPAADAADVGTTARSFDAAGNQDNSADGPGNMHSGSKRKERRKNKKQQYLEQDPSLDFATAVTPKDHVDTLLPSRNEESVDMKPGKQAIRAQQDWSFDALDGATNEDEVSAANKPSRGLPRGGAYQDPTSPAGGYQFRHGSGPILPELRTVQSRESLRSRRSTEPLHIDTSSSPAAWDIDVSKTRATDAKGTLNAPDSRTTSRETATTPLESTTKNRASYLFTSPPAKSYETPDPFSEETAARSQAYAALVGLSAPGIVRSLETQDRSGNRQSHSSSRDEGMLSPRTPLHAIPEERNAVQRSNGETDIGSRSGTKALGRSQTPQAIRTSKERAVSMDVPGGNIRSVSNPLSTDDLIKRLSWPGVDEDKDTVNIDRSLKRPTPRPAMADARPPSVLSNRSNASIGQQFRSPGDMRDIRSFSRNSNRSLTPQLRRIDRSQSGDLRAACRRSESGSAVGGRSSTPKTIPFEAPPTPPPQQDDEEVVLASAAGAAAMSDVFVGRPMAPGCAQYADDSTQQGYGDARGLQASPTRPPSVRKRQSMHIVELESKLGQLEAENRALNSTRDEIEQPGGTGSLTEALATRDLQLREREAEIDRIQMMLGPLHEEIDRLNEINVGLTEANRNLVDDTNGRYATLQAEHSHAHEQWQDTSRELERTQQEHGRFSSGMHDMIQAEVASALADKNTEIARLREELEIATEQIRALQVQIQASKSRDFLTVRDEDYFDGACQKLCQHVQQWVLRFSKLSDNRVCRLSTELRDDKIEARLDNAILDGSDVDKLLGDRVRRRDVFMSVVMTMVWEYVFTRYLFGMDREQRQKLKALEKILQEVGPPRAVSQWRATTLTLLSKRPDFARQCALDTEAVMQEVYSLLYALLPPPESAKKQLQASLLKVMGVAADLAIEMRTQRAEYIMLPPLQPEYDINGDLVRKVHFNASLMNERSGLFSSNEELESERGVVKIVLFPLVVKKGDESGEGEEEIVVCPAQVLVQNEGGRGKKVVRVLSGAMEIDDARSRSRQSLVSTVGGSVAF
ncbi:hypothetical protein LTR62_006611 [Meristemomyces frigidus]|uniref:Involucrin repeat protein n=1 Tax=Meristemomyces frigidus TaxID=1508187 RepID=A0AAN7TNM8_9PEZI|nr:hypothetical protein LTR62_006611 [Meristemomyces frigidus]